MSNSAANTNTSAPASSGLVKPRRWKFYTGGKVWVWVRTRKGDFEKKRLPACFLWGDLTQQNTVVYEQMFWRFYRLEV